MKTEYTAPETVIIVLSAESPVLQDSGKKGFPISDWEEE